MRRVLTAVAVGAVVATGITVSQPEAFAAVDPSGTIELDCDNQTDFNTSLASISWPGTDNVFTALIDDTIDIENTGGTNACTFSVGTALDAGTTSIAAGATATQTVANSGSFSVTPNGGSATTFYVDACSLSGSGFAADPWLVGSGDDLKKVGLESTTASETSCSMAGSYLQTTNITGVDTDADGDFRVDNSSPISDTFSGTYDGDHYSISFSSGSTYEGRDPLFKELSGTVQKLRLTGSIKASNTRVSGLVEFLVGGTLSEVESNVQIEVQDSDAVIGGLVAVAGDNLDGTDMYAGTSPDIENQSSFLQYSSYVGRIAWSDDEGGAEGPTIGGLIGSVRGTGTTELRDSYARASIEFDSGQLFSTVNDTAVLAGGLVGADGLTFVGDGGEMESGNTRSSSASNLRLVRTYAAGSFTNTCEGSAAECNTDSGTHVNTGGLIGFSEDLDDANDLLVASYWLSSSASNPVGLIADSGSQPAEYTSATPGLPEAPGLSSTLMQIVTTYQSEEEGTTDLPSGDADLTVADSTGTLAEQDYRWAIESGNVLTFVASDYDTVSNYLTRNLFADTDVSQTYRREGAGDTSVHGGSDPETVTGYPTLGRVWEICTYANDGYPVLVWEEEDCAAPGSGSSERSQAAEARSLGFTEEEYLRFLDSGLTWEQFTLQLQAENSAALASTGPAAQQLGLGAAASLGFVIGGVALLAAYGRRKLSASSR